MKPIDVVSHTTALIVSILFIVAIIPEFILKPICEIIYERFYQGKKVFKGYSFKLFQIISNYAFKMLGIELIIDKPVC